ncbi:MAG: substrate-binding domain-containing protein [Deltaproteobacteria bacterium]|nr:substrate-binding domain-containing protein [Deltaproteobacteria bacterium]
MNIGTRIKNLFAGMWEDTQAVSPIVATLVLVVVAITGAAAVGTIMGTFSSDVSEESNTGEVTSASSTELLIAGSTTVQPVSELLAEAYMEEHQGVKVTVQGGGSGAGVSSAGLDIVDIGAASRDVKPDELAKYPNIVTHKIGGSAVVVIVNSASSITNASKAEINEIYVNGTASSGNLTTITTVFKRSEESGTQDTFCGWIGNKTDKFHAGVVGKTGNAGVLKAVEDTPNSIGFVDFGFADGSDDVRAINLYDGKQYFVTKDNIKAQLKDSTADTYPDKLARPLNYLTNGEPNSMEQAFITFAMSPGATTYFEECGYFPVTEIA